MAGGLVVRMLAIGGSTPAGSFHQRPQGWSISQCQPELSHLRRTGTIHWITAITSGRKASSSIGQTRLPVFNAAP